ncbi:DNA cytosine methyltransferase [Croceibacterium aestuarii]|uniref:DNA cytosine methyltransferase n=1 Tax=Croceibacterium aestuarii TaxID=3064139 RepID=UPI00272E5F0D|nr:DNA cytosine methyltransferase [Croceibacterium sp. D39]
MIIDNFAGGGGASTGIEAALGRAVDIAINHDEQAIRMHEANHPGTVHIRNNIWQVDPRDVVKGRDVDLAWFSPDCKHFSKAKGGKPREKSIRDLAWVVVLWAQRVKPQLILLENVEEFRTWGPLCAEGKPIPERKGETFDKWCRELRKAGYKLQFRELRACDYGAPTIRKRFFMIARCDGQPIVWPEPTHGAPDSAEVRSGKRKPWRTAAEIIDWSIPCPSIFERKKPLAEKTLRRIAHGIMKFVVNNPRPFVVPAVIVGCGGRRGQSGPVGMDQPYPTTTTKADACLVTPHITKFRSGATGHDIGEPLHTVTANSYVKRPGGSAPLGRVDAVLAPFASYAQQGGANRSVEDPLHTVTASKKDHNVAVAALLQKFAENGKGVDPREPLHTVMAGAPRHAVICAHIEQANGSPEGDKPLPGRAADAPLSTIVAKGCTQRLVTSNLVKLRGTCRDGQSVEEPLHTVSAGGTHMGEVRAFLLKYYGTDQDPRFEEPLHSVTTKDRFGLVTVTIEGEEYVIVDIGMRMLTPRELFNAQGFPPDYIIDRDVDGTPITKTAQVAKCGNSVCPPLAEALVRANMAEAAADHATEAA